MTIDLRKLPKTRATTAAELFKRWGVDPNGARSLRYSDDQPRDEHGRWINEGGGDDISATDVGPVPVGTAPVAHAPATSSKNVTAIAREDAAKYLMPYFGGDVDKASAWAQGNDVYNVNGQPVLIADGASDQLRTSVLDTVQGLQAANPLTGDVRGDPYVVMVNDQPFRSANYPNDVGGFTGQTSGVIAVRPIEPGTSYAEKWHETGDFMPVHADYTPSSYNLIHEWGHAYANGQSSTGGETAVREAMDATEALPHERLVLGLGDKSLGLSTYGQSNYKEAYAESFAQYVGGGQTNRFINTLAEREGWQRLG